MPGVTKWLAGVAASLSMALAGWTYAQGQKVAVLEARVEGLQAAVTVIAANTQADVREIRTRLDALADSRR